MDRALYEFYLPNQSGGGMPVYIGQHNQRGAGFFGALARFALPVVKTIGRALLGGGLDAAHRVVNKRQPVGKAIASSIAKQFAPRKRPATQTTSQPRIKRKVNYVNRKSKI